MVFSEAVGTRTDVVVLAQEAVSLLLTQFPSASIGYYLRVTGQWRLQAASDASPGDFVRPEVLPDDHPLLALASSADQPVFVDDWSATPGRLDTGSTFGTAAGALLRVEGQGQGLLAIGIRGVQNWRDDDRQLVRAVARGLTLALERSSQVRRLEETAVAQRASLAFTEEVGTETDVVVLAQQAIGVLQAHLPGSSASLLTPDGELWKAVAWNPDLPETVVQLIRAGVAGSHPLIERLVQTRLPVFVDHWTPLPEQRLAAPELSRTVAAYPLVLNAQVWGTLSVGLKQDRPWQHQDRALIRAVGRALNLALERAEDLRQLSERRVEQEALNDTLTRERTFLQAVLQNMSEGLVACDERGQLTLFNNATRTFHGQEASPLPPEEWAAHYGLFEGDGVTATTTDRVPLYRAWRGEQLREVELVIRPQQGSVRHLLASGGPMFAPDGQPLGAMVTMRDVTLRRETEQQLARSNAQLTRSNAELKAANEELEAFAYSASHDLRTPVRHVQSFSELVRKELEKTPNDPATRYLGFVEQAAGRMSTLIGAMLQLSRSTRQDLASGPVQLDTLLKQVRQELEPEQEGRQVEWRLGRLPEVQGDPELLRQVLTNLLANAVKFSRTREQPVVEVWGAEVWSEGNLVGWTVFVRDNGVGFDMAHSEKLFGVFSRLHGADEFEGTGAGLAIARRILERHGGTISAEAAPGRGATFRFTVGAPDEFPKTKN